LKQVKSDNFLWNIKEKTKQPTLLRDDKWLLSFSIHLALALEIASESG